MVLGRRGTQNQVGSHLESVIRLQKNPVLIVLGDACAAGAGDVCVRRQQ